MKIKPDTKDVLISLLHERYDSIGRDEAKVWYSLILITKLP